MHHYALKREKPAIFSEIGDESPIDKRPQVLWANLKPIQKAKSDAGELETGKSQHLLRNSDI